MAWSLKKGGMCACFGGSDRIADMCGLYGSDRIADMCGLYVCLDCVCVWLISSFPKIVYLNRLNVQTMCALGRDQQAAISNTCLHICTML